MTSSWKDAVASSPAGVLLRLHVVPGSSKTVFPAGYNEWRRCLEIKVAGEAKENKANIDVIETVAAYFHLASKDVSLVNGERRREKTLLLTNIRLDTVLTQLKEQLNGSKTGARGT
jgi:uncharacterized protein (TIGR00251 family)